MLAFYLRLSKADREKEESNSIDAQRELLWQSLYKYGFSKERVIEYIDDGYSGKNFNRPGITRLFQDMEQGRIQTILVKDFSRFGRNYSEVSEYLEKRFPKIGVRFIAVNNGYDSREQPNQSFSIFQNLFDDYYSEENSQKIRQALFQLKREGNYMAPTAPYGYRKDFSAPYHLVVDPKAAEVVRLIFRLRCEGKSGGEIARYLNGSGVLSPRDYKSGRRGEHIWQSEVIWRILRNQEYLGKLVAGKYHTVLPGGRKRRMLPPEQWIEIEDAHEAIIDRKTFELAQVVGNKRSIQKVRDIERKTESKKQVVYLKGLVICKGCGHKMKRKERPKPFFFCKYYYYDRNPLCLKAGIQEEWLFGMIRQIVRNQIEGWDANDIYRKYKERLQREQKQWERKRKKIEKRWEMKGYLLYERWKDGGIGEEEYKRKREEYQKELEVKEGLSQRIDKEGIEIEGEESDRFFAGLFREILDGIFLNANRQVWIRFHFRI